MNQFYLLPLYSVLTDAIPVGEFFSLGSSSENSYTLKAPGISERHARIQKRGDAYIIRDLQSEDGVWVNGTKVTEAQLSTWDEIRLGENIFLFSPHEKRELQMSSRNSIWANQLHKVNSFALTDFPVLVTGPSGAGKELIARSIHDLSRRLEKPYVTINCSALSESLIESELFGHIKGSFTGATNDRKGAFESARGGTIFLDEIGDLPLSLQPKLLRALENQEIRPVGADRTVETDVRVIAATHKDLEEMVRKKLFREDLFYRLNVCRISPPSLLQRYEDFEDLIYQFAKKLRVRFSHLALLELKKHTWPGNIRELKNAVSRAAAYYPGQHIVPEHIPSLIDPLPQSVTHELIRTRTEDGLPLIKEMEKQLIIERLMINRGNQRRTAEDLGLPKSTLHDRIKTYQINIDQLIPTVQ